ncbi:MAG TPA: Spy/CpxP family protein refolding chaperone [Burkholderiaceae bacterium]|nr:Spy/CpxP family protein refolding chaperone [Burkholderiaceae bacterium]
MNKALAGALLSIGLSSGLAVHAQTGTAPAAQPPAHHGMRHHDGKRAFMRPSERVEARLAYIRTALKITDAQQAQWNAFAETLRAEARRADQRMQELRAQREQRATRERPNAIARLEREQQRHAASVTRINELLAVQRPLYAALSTEQKAVADEVLAPRRHGGRFGRGGTHRLV